MKRQVANRVLSAVGYARAPKATFLLKHPPKGAAALLAYRVARRAAPRRRTLAAATATAVVVPLALRTLRWGSRE